MAETKKKAEAKAPETQAQKHAEKFTKAADEVFENLKKHFEKQKVDAWQEKWLAMPATRKKYQKLADAPEVVGEELVAMTNDIIDFVQGEQGGKSEFLKKLKEKMVGFFRSPISYLQRKAGQGKVMADKAAGQAAAKAKEGAAKAKSTAGPVAKKAKTAAKPAPKKVSKPAKK